MALEKENILLFGMGHTKLRHDKFKWIGPIATTRDILIAKKGSGIKIDSLKDAKKVDRIGTLRGDTKEAFLKMHGFTNIVSTHDEKKNAKKLVFGRIDLWVYKKPGVKTVCDLAEVNYNDLEEVYHLRKRDISIAISKKTSDVIVQMWRNAFVEMSADGTLMRIKKKWNKLL